MKPEEELVWKLIDQDISEPEFQRLQEFFAESRDLRRYYQNCLETHAVLESHVASDGKALHFPSPSPEAVENSKSRPPAWLGWAAAALIFVYFGMSTDSPSKVNLVAVDQADWRGTEVEIGTALPNRVLHLKNGSIEMRFPTKTSAIINGPAFFQVIDDQTLEMIEGKVAITHEGKPASFALLTPAGKVNDLGTRFTAFIENLEESTKVHAKVLEGKIEFENSFTKQNSIFNAGESLVITGTHRKAKSHVKFAEQADLERVETLPEIGTIAQQQDYPNSSTGKQIEFKAIDLMLEGNLKAQIKYSMVEAIAESIDQKTMVLTEAEKDFSSNQSISFAEAAMPEIEAMAHSIVEGYIDFSKISLWEASKTAEVAWRENKDAEGKIISRIPYANRLNTPEKGNRLLHNLEQIKLWLQTVHDIHKEKGMGWVSSFGCPEDGKLIFDNRNKKLFAISHAIDSIKSNLE